MKRDWKLIRAILCREDESAWPTDVVALHYGLCDEAGYIRAVVSYPCDEWSHAHLVHVNERGFEVADILRNREDLDAVIARLDAAAVGHCEDFVLGAMKRMAVARLEKTEVAK